MPARTSSTSREALRFSIDARVVEHFGLELVSKPTVALAELVKNAYDADATRVSVSFRHLGTSRANIEIRDNGSGMKEDQVKGSWMRIATPEKQDNPRSPQYKRPRAGRKGIGRFASHRIGSTLFLATRAKSQPMQFVRFAWDDYEAGKELAEIPNRHHSWPAPTARQDETGTILRIRGLRDDWTKIRLKELRTYLTDILSPPTLLVQVPDTADLHHDPGIRVVFDGFPDEELTSLELNREFLDCAWATLSGEVSKREGVQYTLDFRRSKKTFVHSIPKTVIAPDSTGHFSFKIHYFNYKREHLKDVAWGVGQAREVGAYAGGVRIYRDNIRVMPYGKSGFDWLDLDQRRGRRLTVPLFEDLLPKVRNTVRPMLDLPGNNQLFGVIALSSETNPELRDTTNREGLVQNDAYGNLCKIVTTGIEWLTLEFNRLRLQDRKKLKEEKTSFSKNVEVLRETIKQEHRITTPIRKSLLTYVGRISQAYKEDTSHQIDQLSLYRILASFGISFLAFGHEISEELGAISDGLDDLKSTTLSHKDRKATLRDMQKAMAEIETFLEYSKLFAAKGRRPKRRRIQLLQSINSVKEFYHKRGKKLGITIVPHVKPGILVGPIVPAELTSVLGNLLSNAFKWVQVTKKKKRIEIRSRPRKNMAIVEFLDSGPGIPSKHREQVFEPFFSTSRGIDDLEQSMSIGLGLTIVREVCESYNGSAEVIQKSPGGMGGIRISLPRG